MSRELHVIIIWEKARQYTQAVEEEILKVFNIVCKCQYCWDSSNASENYAAFYGEKLEDIQYKVEHCGKGSFIVYIVEDNNPKYQIRETTSGTRKVNTNLFDLKIVLRGMTGGGHQIHASDTSTEANTNSLSLFGKKITEAAFELKNMQDKAATEEPIKVRRNITGVDGWKNWNEFFDILNKCTEYVVLRNYETILEQNKEQHGDTDLLVYDREAAKAIIAGNKVFWGKERVLYSIKIAGREELIDLRYVGDNYYCRDWQTTIIERRCMHESNIFYVADNEEQSYMLLYHALVHKPFLSRDYSKKLEELFGELTREGLKKKLKEFMNVNKYQYVLPKDDSVYVHPDYFRYMKISFHRKMYCKLKEMRYKRIKDESENRKYNKWSKTLYKVLSRGYYLVIQTLRRIKAGIRKIRHKKN